MTDTPSRVVIAGGGVGGLEAALALQALAPGRLDVTLVADVPDFVYRPLAVGVPFDGASTVRVRLDAVAEERGFAFVRDRIAAVEEDRRLVMPVGGDPLPYDHLVMALGAGQRAAIDGALTFRGPQDVERLRAALGALEDHEGGHVVFAARSITDWTLPLYELALLTSSWAGRRELDLKVSLVTAERAPLEAFGPDVSAEVAALLAGHRIDFHGASMADAVVDGALRIQMEGLIAADLVVALPVLVGRPVRGLPHDERGFVAVDELCRVRGMDRVYAIGDMTDRPLRQGGLAAQQADVAAACIAAAAGAVVPVEPYEPVLRALLFTGDRPRYLRHPAADVHEGPAHDLNAQPWWPPHKIVGAHLAPYLATHADLLERAG